MIPELNGFQNRRVVNENITLPFGHKWLSLKEWYGKTLPKDSKYWCAGNWRVTKDVFTNEISVICTPIYPEIPSGYKLVMKGEKIEDGYKYCVHGNSEWKEDRFENSESGGTFLISERPYLFFINPIVRAESLSDKVRKLEVENATLKEKFANYQAENVCLKHNIDTLGTEKRNLAQTNADLINRTISLKNIANSNIAEIDKLRRENETLKDKTNPDEGLLKEISYLKKRLTDTIAKNVELIKERNQRSLEFTTLRNRNDELARELSSIKEAWQKLGDLLNKKS